MAAAAAARNVGVTPEIAVQALCAFGGVKRRMEFLGEVAGVKVYDDFAHHPTAIATTLEGLRAKVGNDKIIALIEPRSNTMRMGIHKQHLGHACMAADGVFWYQPEGVDWGLHSVVNHSPVAAKLNHNIDEMIADCVRLSEANTHVVIMSNGGFGGVHQKLLDKLAQQ